MAHTAFTLANMIHRLRPAHFRPRWIRDPQIEYHWLWRMEGTQTRRQTSAGCIFTQDGVLNADAK